MIADAAFTDIEDILRYVIVEDREKTKKISPEKRISTSPGGLEKSLVLESKSRNIGDVAEQISITKEPEHTKVVYDLDRFPGEMFQVNTNIYAEAASQSDDFYDAVRPSIPSEMFHKETAYVDPYIREVKSHFWYIKYRTVTQNLRNVTLLRGIISMLEKRGLVTAIKKVK